MSNTTPTNSPPIAHDPSPVMDSGIPSNGKDVKDCFSLSCDTSHSASDQSTSTMKSVARVSSHSLKFAKKKTNQTHEVTISRSLLKGSAKAKPESQRLLHSELRSEENTWKLLGESLLAVMQKLGLFRQANSSKNSPCFNKLPGEILQIIASSLPLAALVALTLTSKSLLNLLGNMSWEELALQHRKTDRFDFLALLERDVCAKYWLCDECDVLHSKAIVNKRGFRDCKNLQRGQLFNHSYSMLRWAHIHLVMQRHLRGKDFGLPIEALSETLRPPSQWYFKQVCKFVKEGKIINNEVYLKATLTVDASISKVDYRAELCKHLRTPYKPDLGYHEKFQQLLSCRLKHLNSQHEFCAFCAPAIRRCQYCALEYDFSAMKTWLGPKLIFDVWVNLGAGQSNKDVKWEWPAGWGVHCYGEPLQFEVGSIRAKYESN